MMEEQLQKIRHSICHLMSMAMQEIYPQVGLGVGPYIEDGFYQDYDLPEPIGDEILPKLEKRIKEMIKQKIDFVQHDMDFDSALEIYKHDPYKTEMILDLKAKGEKVVSFYKSDWFENLCLGPHVNNTSEIDLEAFKLTRIAGAYWRGDEKNKMLTRIYGVAFANKKELDEYLFRQEEAERRDHRKLGAELDLFVFSDLVGKGLPLLTPRGTAIRKELEKFVLEEETKRGYQHVITPPLAKVDLYKTSGHYPYYKDTMYPVMKVDDDELILRPMTCPHHFMLYKSRPHSYRELPLRLAEISPQFRYEKSGELAGLMRVRMFCLADAHIIATTEQAADEIKNVLELIDYANKAFGLKKGEDYRYRLSLGDRTNEDKYYKDDKAWDQAEDILRQVLKETGAPFFEAPGEAAFYGPKIDVQVKKVNGHEETAFTVQYDFVMPKRFDLKYTDSDGQEKQPIVIHRSSIGAFERTMAFLIERYAGAFPVWLAPVQVVFVPVSAKFNDQARELAREFYAEDKIRAEVEDADETVGNKVRKALQKKTPYVIVIGEKEISGQPWMIRVRGQEEQLKMAKNEFLEKIKSQIVNRQ
ncbi:MAG: threonine--tRNA ligase [Candidatus Magasanikbacteria bacterium CG10_big_fil_rev_8_21_14_0_10_40_10]|uniref:Threonine--tRNA ligase n=1 Tax=Candidatus Magasanikbacteria bacterium CG10_big_fil_rev_8_21_14_0_10_40_10 TaxID=1974648 RepID=A0A2M6W3N3_9BACT|nr:MAG: threonine--tRNA ligase [Candidatus Magasanikbacteria bacterium CG10_big_fil_rev_8_21_14_0_10_40_10]